MSISNAIPFESAPSPHGKLYQAHVKFGSYTLTEGEKYWWMKFGYAPALRADDLEHAIKLAEDDYSWRQAGCPR